MNSFYEAGIPLGSIFGIPVRLHVLFPVVLILQVVVAGLADGGLAAAFWLVVIGPILYLTVLIHELGHSLACRKVGGTAHSILLWPLGGLAFIGHSSGPKADLFVAAAGPLTHIPLFGITAAILLIATAAHGHANLDIFTGYDLHHEFGISIAKAACEMQVLLFAFNVCIPAYPLDGGRMMADLLLCCGVAVPTAAIVTVAVAVPLAVAIIALGIYWGLWLTAVIGVWLLWSEWQLIECIRAGAVAQHPMFSFSASAAESIPDSRHGGSAYAVNGADAL